MNRKEKRKNKDYVGKSLWRSISRYNLPEEGKDLIIHTKYGKQHTGVYKHPTFFVYMSDCKKMIPFGHSEIIKWEYVNISKENNSEMSKKTNEVKEV
ncbi:MAG TPA: hypothetical protein P5513_04470 [Candidatus Diapherotrites archaeon]|nr:hypothetical protein [Candidatus Diapherotrites archaeon]